MIEWKKGAVCYAGGWQWLSNESVKPYKLVNNCCGTRLETFEGALSFDNFQLNEIRIGDYIEKSELDTERKYKDVVDVFGLFGCLRALYGVLEYDQFKNDEILIRSRDGLNQAKNWATNKVRKLTYNQIMAIGKLKRMMNEREEVKESESVNRVAATGSVGCLSVDLVDAHRKINEALSKPRVSADKKHKPIVAQVMVDLTERMEVGIKEYGEALRPHNGRDALQDAYEEALDLACYLKQAIIERDSK